MSKKWALITGATVGIGDAFARHLAAEGYNLVINARSLDKLEERAAFLRKSFNVEVEVLAADLARDCEKVEAYIASHEIEVLINNAGFGLNQSFLSSDIADEQRRVWIGVPAFEVVDFVDFSRAPSQVGGRL